MYAILREHRRESGTQGDSLRALAQVKALHACQPGFAGSLSIHDGPRVIVINLWESEHAAAAGRKAIGTQVQRLLDPLSGGTSELIAAGEVLVSDVRGASSAAGRIATTQLAEADA